MRLNQVRGNTVHDTHCNNGYHHKHVEDDHQRNPQFHSLVLLRLQFRKRGISPTVVLGGHVVYNEVGHRNEYQNQAVKAGDKNSDETLVVVIKFDSNKVCF